MKFSPSVLALSALVACAATATAFSMGPANSITNSRQQSASSSTSSTKLQMSADELAKSAIESNDVVVFSKSYCPFCDSTKALFKELNVEPKVYELNQMGDEGPELQMALFKMTGQKSVPNVFVKGQHVGGNDDTQAAAKAGKLQEMLA
eukprot:CAMPEP_0117039786 /NCGR_PEP_ID=MMETSP0472-20121206/27893_1 /TAXON_ID=693140 ORGANISM="Tiarina fusus, Strain LIS" /NCGR_SAMPLE_ID=MMETSP0472 /ASSEMBLY_ACC=CAM_ASM_000603 /LENGTH=148 /DNA_ID=CAMNT_0004750357 /DNA_START=106 /DNA_END=549 /DNA_ORIENTATION=-